MKWLKKLFSKKKDPFICAAELIENDPGIWRRGAMLGPRTTQARSIVPLASTSVTTAAEYNGPLEDCRMCATGLLAYCGAPISEHENYIAGLSVNNIITFNDDQDRTPQEIAAAMRNRTGPFAPGAK